MAKKFVCDVCGQTFEAEKMPSTCPFCQADTTHIKEVETSSSSAEAKKKGLNTNSNTYTIVYAAVMVIVVAFLLAFISDSLRSKQEENVANDKRSQILASLGMTEIDDVQAAYQESVIKELVINANGDSIGNNAFDKETKDINDNCLPLYVCKTNNDTLYVVPLSGRGLWGGLWGYLALKKDFKTVAGAYFSHEGETAGLGARIVEPDFQKKFIGKDVFTDSTFTQVALGVMKKVVNEKAEVDAITGATLTSNGVNDMLRDCISRYQKYFKANTTK